MPPGFKTQHKKKKTVAYLPFFLGLKHLRHTEVKLTSTVSEEINHKHGKSKRGKGRKRQKNESCCRCSGGSPGCATWAQVWRRSFTCHRRLCLPELRLQAAGRDVSSSGDRAEASHCPHSHITAFTETLKGRFGGLKYVNLCV